MQGATLYGTPGEISTPPLLKPSFVLTDTVGAPFDLWQKARGYVDLVYAGHMLDTARRAVRLAAGKNRADFDCDEVLSLALTHLVQVIGEAARQVSPDFRAKHPEIRWICTDEGLSRFDEREFRTYTRQNGIPHIHVNAILETRDGEYWIATDGGVARCHPRDPGKQFESFDRGPDSQTGDDSSRGSFNSCRVSIVFRPKRC